MSWRDVSEVLFDTSKLIGGLFPVLMLAVCLNLIVAMGAFSDGFGEVVKAALPFIALMLLGLIIVALVPQLTLFPL